MKKSKRQIKSRNVQIKKSRESISKYWKNYRKQKQTILKNYKTKQAQKIKTKELLKKTYKKISSRWENYREKKIVIFHKKDLSYFGLYRTKIHKEKISKYYNFGKNYRDIDRYITEFEGYEFLLVIYKWENKETGSIRYTSISFSPEMMKRVLENDESIFSAMIIQLEQAIKTKFSDDIEGYEVVDVFVRTENYIKK